MLLVAGAAVPGNDGGVDSDDDDDVERLWPRVIDSGWAPVRSIVAVGGPPMVDVEDTASDPFRDDNHKRRCPNESNMEQRQESASRDNTGLDNLIISSV